MRVFDADFRVYFLDPNLRDGIGRNPRLDQLVASLQESGERIAIPTPALGELVVKAGDAGPKYLQIITRSKFSSVVDFDMRAAVELAALTREAIASGDKRGATPEAPWTKVKFDRQIIAIARVIGATTIHSNDEQLARHATAAGIAVVSLASLPDPPKPPQLELELEAEEPPSVVEDDEDEP